jgi:PAS domain S-box-containing protein
MNLTAAKRIGLVYLLASTLWIFVSDGWWAYLIGEAAPPAGLQSAKSFFWVTFSTLLIFALIHRESTRQAELLQRVQASRDAFRRIFEGYPVPLLVFDPRERRILNVNEAAVRQYGKSRNDLLEAVLDDIWLDLEVPRLQEAIRSGIDNFPAGPWRHLAPGERFIHVKILCQPLNEGDRRLWMMAAVDISGEVAAKTRLARALEETSQAEQAQHNLLANVSHELRSPLHAIISLAQMVEMDLAESESLGEAKQLREQAEHLLQLINRLLDAASLDHPQTEIQSLPFDLRDLCEELTETYLPICEAKDLRFGFFYAEDLPRKISGDPVAIRKILLNLLSNAAKFTESGSVCLEAKRADTREASVDIRIIDTGIGIAPSDRERIFEPFTQLDEGLGRVYSGCGLGLHLAAGLAERCGGSVVLEKSDPARGSVFRLRLPLTPPALIAI